MSDKINWKEITSSDTVKALLIRRDEFEKVIRRIDSDALTNYELAKLKNTQANEANKNTDKALILSGAEKSVCETCRDGFWLRKNTKCLDCGKVKLEDD